jgi:sterol 3beta-glucosyltransferase
MRMTLATLGSRGDVQPMVVLGTELRRRGHDIVFAVPPNLIEFVGRAGFAARPVGPDSQAFVESADGQRWLASGNARAFLKAMGEIGHEIAPQADAELLKACEGAEAIVCGILGEDHALCVAEAQGIPLVTIHLAPARSTGRYPNYLVTTRSIPSRLVNRATAVLVERIIWQTLRADTNVLRSQLGLAPVATTTPSRMARMGITELQGYSRLLVPGLDDYGLNRPFTGFLTPDPEVRGWLGESGVDPSLDAWLSAGEPPAYFGFGSMPVADPASMVAMIGRVSGRLGLRALVSAGWSGMHAGRDDTERLRVTGELNHDLVLPRCRLAVHHGGAGTVASSVMAGIPSFVCSVFADQLFWGARLAELGCGVHVRFPALDEHSLEAGLRQLLGPEVDRRSVALGAQLRAEVGTAARAADLVEESCGH